MSHLIKPGVATGNEVQAIFKLAKSKKFALPAVNVIGSNTINTVLETAKELNSPVIIQFSNGGAQFNAGKGLSNEGQKAAIAGGVAGAKHIHTLSEATNILVDGNVEITIELSSDNSKPIGLAGEAKYFVDKKITIIDNDCPIILADMVGTYTGKDNWYASVGGPLDTKIITSFDGTSFKMTGIGHAWLANPVYWGEPVVTEGTITVEIDAITGNFEIPYYGGFQLTNYVPSLEMYLNIGQEVICYNDIDELELLINYYL